MFKLVDRIFVHHIQHYISLQENYINKEIFKSNIDRKKNFSCQEIGIKGTETKDSVILLDFKNAFDFEVLARYRGRWVSMRYGRYDTN
jgi:hypothetical protein